MLFLMKIGIVVMSLLLRNWGNEMMLWHGTRAFNILSIFKVGLIIPRSGGSYHITGRAVW